MILAWLILEWYSSSEQMCVHTGGMVTYITLTPSIYGSSPNPPAAGFPSGRVQWGSHSCRCPLEDAWACSGPPSGWRAVLIYLTKYKFKIYVLRRETASCSHNENMILFNKENKYSEEETIYSIHFTMCNFIFFVFLLLEQG